MPTEQNAGPDAGRSPEGKVAAPSRRERTRAATIAEIKAVALRLMHETGTTDLRFSDIAREMGMTAPGLYRYFAGSDELLTELIVDAYDNLGAAVAGAREAEPADDLWARLFATCAAYRAWARQEPQQFALIFGMPVPGYCAADTEGPATEAAKRAMGQLQSIFLDAAQRGELSAPLITATDAAFVAGINKAHDDDHLMPGAWEADRAAVAEALTPVTMQAMLMFWASLHGFVSIDAYSHLDWIDADARDALFRTTIQQAARCAGLPSGG